MKIFHISDLHFGMHHEHIIKPFLEEVGKEQPDVILISGDFTNRAKSVQYEELKTELLDKITTNLVIIQGNHDIPFYNVLARFSNPYRNYNKYIKEHYPQSLQNKICTLIGLDSTNVFQTKDGRISEKSMAGIKDFFSADHSTIHLLSFHHNLERVDNLHRPIQNFEEVINFIKTTPINIICTGHLHKAHTTQITKNDGSKCLVLHAGSLLCKRTRDGYNSYFEINLHERHHCEVKWKVFDHTSFKTESISSYNI